MQLNANGNGNRTVILKTTLLLVAITINALEFFVPRIPFLPWLKPGLANCVTLVWIIRFGGRDALLFSFLRIWLVGFYFGFSFITLSLALSGGIMATCAMGVVWHLLGRRRIIGTVGTAIVGAIFHNMGQIIAVFFLLAYNVYLFYQVPFMIIASLLFGGLVGVLTPLLSQLADRAFEAVNDTVISLPVNSTTSRTYTAISVGMLMLSISLVLIYNRSVLLILALLTTLSVQIIHSGSLQAFFFPIRRFWLLFLFVACFNIFPAYGKRIPWIPFLTEEGIQSTAIQWLRLWSWLQISLLLTYFKFHTVIFRTLSFFFKKHKFTLYAGLLAVEDFPEVFDLMRKRAAMEFRAMLRQPIITSRNAISRAFYEVEGFVIRRHQEAISEERQ
jgi:heptaprenyl diphosphate synthase